MTIVRQKAIPPQETQSAAPDRRATVKLSTLILAIALTIYALAFLSQPLLEGITADSGRNVISRAAYLISTLIYPDGLIQSWSDDGRLGTGILDRMPIALLTAMWLGLAAAIGWPWSQWSVSPESESAAPGNLERLSWSMLIGLAWLSTITLLVGWAGWLAILDPVHIPMRAPLVLVAFALWAASHGVHSLISKSMTRQATRAAKKAATSSTRTTRQNTRQTNWIDQQLSDAERMAAATPMDQGLRVIKWIMIAWLAATIMLGAWVPPSEFDVLEYHLQAPKEFFQNGAITFVPHNIYANMPLGAEMHSLAAMTLLGTYDGWLGAMVGKSISASFALITAVLIGMWLKRRYGSGVGLTAAAIWLASPGIAHVSTLGLIDGVLASYVIATALAACEAYRAARANQHATGIWFVASIMAGAAAACKYPGLIFAVAPLAVIFVASRGWLSKPADSVQTSNENTQDRAPHNSWTTITLCMVIGLASTCLPWYAKNAVMAGNPVYPLAASLFGGRTLNAEKIQQWQTAHRVPPAASADASFVSHVTGRILQLIHDLHRLTVSSSFVQPSMIIGVIILATIIVVQPQSRRSDFAIWLCWSLWILIVWWSATHRIDRFWLPLVGLWSVLAAAGLMTIKQRKGWLVETVLLCGLLYASLFNCSSMLTDNRYFAALSGLRTDACDGENVGRLSRHLAWVNDHLSSAQHRVLTIGEAAVFDYQVPIIYSTCFDQNPGEAWLTTGDAQARWQALQERQITHVMINWQEINRYRSPGNYGFSTWPTPEAIAALVDEGLLSRVEWPIDSKSVELYEVVQPKAK